MNDQYIKFTKFNEDINLDKFSIDQERILFEDFVENGKVKFSRVSTKYEVSFQKAEVFSKDKIPLIIPIRNLSGLLEYTLANLQKFEATDHVNIFVVDDRSDESIKEECDKYDFVSYIRCDYNSGFNYAMLANLAALISFKLGFKEIIYWNSDMYLPDTSTLPSLIQKHRNDKPVISGTKLLYPFEGWKIDQEVTNEGSMDRSSLQQLMLQKSHMGKVQFGGPGFNIHNNNINFFHACRGFAKDNIYVNVDKGCHAVTGAYSMMDLEWLVSVGGFNPSLAKIYNDIDICLRACEQRKAVVYYGKDTFLYHEESVNLNNNTGEPKVDHQFNSDAVLFSKLWHINRFNQATMF